MEFKSQDEEIQYWKLKNKVLECRIDLLNAIKEFSEFENNIDYEK